MKARTRALMLAPLAMVFVLACQDSGPTVIEPTDPGMQAAKGGKGGGPGGSEPDTIMMSLAGGFVTSAPDTALITAETNNRIEIGGATSDFEACRADPTGTDPGCFFVELELSSILDVGGCVAANQAAMDSVLLLLDDPEQGRFGFQVAINTRNNPSDRNNQIKLFWIEDAWGQRVDLLVTTDKQVFPNNKLTVQRDVDVTGEIETFTFTNGSVWFPGGAIGGTVTCPFAPGGEIVLTMDRTPWD